MGFSCEGFERLLAEAAGWEQRLLSRSGQRLDSPTVETEQDTTEAGDRRGRQSKNMVMRIVLYGHQDHLDNTTHDAKTHIKYALKVMGDSILSKLDEPIGGRAPPPMFTLLLIGRFFDRLWLRYEGWIEAQSCFRV